MGQTRPVPGIARGPQNFSPRNLPPIPNPMGPTEQAAQDAVVALRDAIAVADGESRAQALVPVEDELAMEIYARLVSDCLKSDLQTGPEKLRAMATEAKAAAAIYFEGEHANG